MFASLPAPKQNPKRAGDEANATDRSESKHPRVDGPEPSQATAPAAGAAAAPPPTAYRVTAAAFSEDKGSRKTFEDVAVIRLEDS